MFVNIEVSDIADSIFYLIEISIFRYIRYLFRYFGVEIFCIMQRGSCQTCRTRFERLQ